MMGDGSFPGVKQPGCGINHPLAYSSRVTENRAMPLLPICPCMAGYRRKFTFYFYAL